MSRTKSPKHGLSLFNLQICRPKNPSSMIKSPLPALSYTYSPVNSKTYDISFPSFPDPPPSTPSTTIQMENEFTSHACSKPRSEEKQYCSSHFSSDYKETDWQIAQSKTDKKKHKSMRKKSILSGDCDETASLFSSHDSNHPLKTAYDEESSKKVPLMQKSAKTRRFKRYGSKEWGGEYQEKKVISGRVGPCMVDHGKVNESFMVVKKSVNPYEDFKKSMSEMIVAKQLFEPKELEELLMSFLSLNSRLHHKVIIEAFAEVLEEVLCG